MNRAECAKVLAKIQLGDNRQVDHLTLEEWFDTIGHLEFEDAVAGVKFHRQESSVYLMPAHVVAGARRNRAQRERDARVSGPRALGRPVITLDRARFEQETLAAIEEHRASR